MDKPKRKPRRISYLVGHKPGAQEHRSPINSLSCVSHMAFGNNPGDSGIRRVIEYVFTGGRDAAVRCYAVTETRNEPPAIKFQFALEDHVDWVNDVLVLKEHSLLASCSSDGTVKLYDLQIGEPDSSGRSVTANRLQDLWGHTDYVQVLRYGRVGQVLASAGLDNNVILWDLHTLQPKTNIRHDVRGIQLLATHSSIYSMNMDDECNCVFVGSADKLIRMYDTRTGKKALTLRGHKDNVRDILLLRSDGHPWLASGSTDHTVKLWDTRNCKCAASYAVHHDSVWSLAAYTGGFRSPPNTSTSTEHKPPPMTGSGIFGGGGSFPPVKHGVEGFISGGRDKRIYFINPKPNQAFNTPTSSHSAALVAEMPSPVVKVALNNEDRSLWVCTSSPHPCLHRYDISCIRAWSDEERHKRTRHEDPQQPPSTVGAEQGVGRPHSTSSNSSSPALLHCPSSASIEYKSSKLTFYKLNHCQPNIHTLPPSLYPPPAPPTATVSEANVGSTSSQSLGKQTAVMDSTTMSTCSVSRTTSPVGIVSNNSNTQTAQTVNSTSNTTGTCTSKTPSDSHGIPIAASSIPDLPMLCTVPDVNIRGAPAIVEYKILNDKRHVLAKDEADVLTLWDITTGREVAHWASVGPDCTLQKKEEELNEVIYVPHWCTVDTRLGGLMVHLACNDCFNADMYLCDCFNDIPKKCEDTLNLGAEVAKCLFSALIDDGRHSKHAHHAKDRTNPNSPTTTNDPHSNSRKQEKKGHGLHFNLPSHTVMVMWGERPVSPFLTQQAQRAVQMACQKHTVEDDEDDYDDSYQNNTTTMSVGGARGSTTRPGFHLGQGAISNVTLSTMQHWRKQLQNMNSQDVHFVPSWMVQSIQQNFPPTKERESTKVSFALESVNPKELKDVLAKNNKLTAPRVLRIQKVSQYVAEHLNLQLPTITRNGEDGQAETLTIPADEFIQVITKKAAGSTQIQELTKYTDMGTVAHCYRPKGASSLTLYYRKNPAYLPSNTGHPGIIKELNK